MRIATHPPTHPHAATISEYHCRPHECISAEHDVDHRKSKNPKASDTHMRFCNALREKCRRGLGHAILQLKAFAIRLAFNNLAHEPTL